MLALITGGSSGIGFSIAKELSNRGYDLIIVSRNASMLDYKFNTNTELISGDLSSIIECRELYNLLKDKQIDILVNSAGFGLFGEFSNSPIEKELNMIDLNIRALHMLTKLFLSDFKERNSGYILNIASFAGFMPGGPLMSTYYATKSYVLSLTNSIYKELKQSSSNVCISVLCPGPVKTNFDKTAGVSFSINGLDSDYVAKYAVKQLLNKKRVIIPGNIMKLAYYFYRFFPTETLLQFCYKFQSQKNK